MRQFKNVLWLSILVLLSAQAVHATTVQVGTCETGLQSFTTISLAVSGRSPGDTVDVCPGTYAEQVTITTPLTLVGVTSGTANQASITVPTGGLAANTVSMFGESVAAQILVQGAGPVNITNLTVDGTGGDMGCSGNIWVAGVYYSSGSSGTVDQVRASNQTDGTCGVGIWAENSSTTSETVTVQNSTVYNVDSAGVFAGSNPTPSLTAILKSNVVSTSGAVAAIDSDSVKGEVSSNDITTTASTTGSTSPLPFGVYNLSRSSVSSNTILGTTNGIYMGSGGTASNNRVSGSSIGVLLGASATLSGNRIFSSTTEGIELGCFSATVSNNTINDAPIGVDSAPGTVALGTNTFANTATTVTNGCAAPAALALRTSGATGATALSTYANTTEQWHTPATPFGTRRR